MRFIFTLLLSGLLNVALQAQPGSNTVLKTTGLKERLIASSHHQGSLTYTELIDSFRYKYSGTNGSRWRMEYGFFDDYDKHYLAGHPDEYDYNWSQLDIAADSAWEWTPDNYMNIVLYYQLAAWHNNMGKLDSIKYYYYGPNLPYPGGYDYYSYDTQGRVLRTLELMNTATGPDTMGRIDYYYNQQGQLTFDSIRAYSNGAWHAWAAISRTYDPQGNLSSLKYDQMFSYPGPHWTTRHEYHYTYYPAPNTYLKTVDYYYMEGAGSRDSMEYVGSNPIAVKVTSFNKNGSAWVPAVERVRHMNAQGLPDSIYLKVGAGPSELKDVYTYSAHRNPTERITFQGQPPVAYVRYRYYYEVYSDPSGIVTVKPSEEIKAYPNPATGKITVSWKEGEARRVSVQLVNAAGQQVMTARITWQGTDQHFSIRHLSAGMYWLVLRDESGVVLFREGLVKQ